MVRVSFSDCNSLLYNFVAKNIHYWSDKCVIPIGTVKPYFHYIIDGVLDIPMSDIVVIPFENVDTPLTQRDSFNVLSLAGSGDGKGLLQKLGWSVLADAGFFIVYVDPKSFDASRAKVGWNSEKLAPYMVAKGINLAPYVPVSSIDKIPHLAHNFRKYSMKISSLHKRDFWIGLGMSQTAASVTAKLIQGRYNGGSADFVGVKLDSLFNLRKALVIISRDHDDELPKITLGNAIRCLSMVEDFKVVTDDARELDMWKVWTAEKKSVVISLNNLIPQFLTFEVGFRIWESYQYFFTHRNLPENKPFANRPIMYFLDDAKFFADNFDPKIVPYNFAIDQIKEIGFNYRSAGIYNWLSVQSLAILDETAAESYPYKLISPYFKNPDSLRKINIPAKAIDYLKNNVLVKRKDIHLIQWLLIDADNAVTPFFPFTPPCNHFKPVNHPKVVGVDV